MEMFCYMKWSVRHHKSRRVSH
ncbi:hypothetical protein ABSL22_000277 [Escherichia coli]|nr:hypothetical protein [Escherichia coli]EJE3857581.1 hypothetical protein [Escherichia coli]EJZ1813693.1 hypothetical protein [Escherichia coli]ELA5608411.1 hypothetical protein [Escherichia coli]